jgi:hypothetical protein
MQVQEFATPIAHLKQNPAIQLYECPVGEFINLILALMEDSVCFNEKFSIDEIHSNYYIHNSIFTPNKKKTFFQSIIVILFSCRAPIRSRKLRNFTAKMSSSADSSVFPND